MAFAAVSASRGGFASLVSPAYRAKRSNTWRASPFHQLQALRDSFPRPSSGYAWPRNDWRRSARKLCATNGRRVRQLFMSP